MDDLTQLARPEQQTIKAGPGIARRTADVGVSALDALALDFGDNIAGLIGGTGAAIIPGGRGFQEGYQESRDAVRNSKDRARTNNPKLNFAAEVGSPP